MPPIWNGIYAGVHGGANWLALSTEPDGSGELRAGTLGIHIGLAKQVGSWIFGAETDLDFSSAEERVNFDVSLPPYTISGTARAEIAANGSVRGRIGYAVMPELMVYATAGYAWASVESSFSGTINGTAASGSWGTTLDGFTYGGGLEAYISPQLLLRIEYLHTDYADQTLSSSVAGAENLNISLDSDVIRAGITWRFN